MNRFTSIGGKEINFPKTHWTLILRAQDRDSVDVKDKLEYLIQTYWKPVYTYILLSWRKSNEEAKDLTQEFFTVFMDKDYINDVVENKGKFRYFLLTSLKHFLMDQKKRARAKKRGGDRSGVSLDNIRDNLASNNSDTDPVHQFNIEWAKALLTRSVEQLKKELARRGKGEYYRIFELYGLGSNELSYEQIAERLGILKNDVVTAMRYSKKVLRELIIDELGKSVASEDDLVEEYELLKMVRGGVARGK